MPFATWLQADLSGEHLLAGLSSADESTRGFDGI
jgi:hypothetical protein